MPKTPVGLTEAFCVAIYYGGELYAGNTETDPFNPPTTKTHVFQNFEKEIPIDMEPFQYPIYIGFQVDPE